MSEQAPSAAEAEKIQERAAYKELLVNEFSDPTERKIVQKQLDEVYGLGLEAEEAPADGETVENNTDQLKIEAQEKLDKEDEEPEIKPAETKEDETKAEVKAEEKVEAQEEKTEEPEWKQAIEELKSEIAKRDIKITELEAKGTLNEADKEIREEVSRAMASTLKAQETVDAETQKKIAKHREEYGDDAAAELESQYQEMKKLRDEQNQNQMEAEYEKRKAARESQIQEKLNVDKMIASQTELKQWKDEGHANYHLATYYDSVLMDQPEWKDKPLTERFAEVVKMVKAHVGQERSGTPTPPVDKESKEKTAEQAAADILKEAREKAQAKAPETLTDIKSPTQGTDPMSLESVADLSHDELFDKMTSGSLSVKALDQMINSNESEFYHQIN